MEIQDISRAFMLFSLVLSSVVYAAGNNLTTEIGALPICAVRFPLFF